MHSTIILSLLAASSVIAVPLSRRQDSIVADDADEVRIKLATDGISNSFGFRGVSRETIAPVLKDPFKTIEVTVGALIQDKDIRCQAINEFGNPIVATRGANVDITFADGGNGPWTFREESIVSNVICDPAFEKIDAADPRLNLVIEVTPDSAADPLSRVSLKAGERTEVTRQASDPVAASVNLSTGEFVENQGYRCAIFGVDGLPITVTRGENVDTTFSDAGNGPWTFPPQEVTKIVCDPTFVKAP